MPISNTGSLGLRTLEDITSLILQSHDLSQTLQNIVDLVAKRMRTEVCSIYLLDADQPVLRLSATRGLAPESVGKVALGLDEGLVGLAAQERRVISIEEPQNHPRFRYFAETGEEQYHSFLGIPLFDRKLPIGVIAIQTLDRRVFAAAEISVLQTIAFQVSSIVINARLLDSIQQRDALTQVALDYVGKREQQPPTATGDAHPILRGKVAYPGVASGPAHLLDERLGLTDILDEEGVDADQELDDLHDAIEKTRIQTLFLEKRVAEKLTSDDAAIFHTHLMILEDRSFLDKLEREITSGHSAPYALKKVVGGYIEAFANMEDSYLRERAADMDDIGRRLLANLIGREDQTLHLKTPGILVAREILPSDMAGLDHEQLLGIVTEAGERNSHAVIMAKSLGIPALVGVKGLLKQLEPEEPVILDANSGTFYIRPSTTIREEYRRLEDDCRRELHRLEEFRDIPARTLDGERILLRANIGLVSDVDVALRNGAEGVGLYRTEFPYMARGDFPDRNDQYQLYSKVVDGFNGQPVTIRTLDIGGDKALPYFAPPKEDNPFMGWRSVRVSLDNTDIFRTQIEAILMAGLHGPVKLLFPMISSMEEVSACRAIVEQAKQNLTNEKIPFADNIPLGVMIEVPAAVHIARQLARQVDFFALGTNDLVQYLLAADRNNPLVNKYYDPLHPAVLRVLHDLAQIARETDTGVCLCGEMGTDPLNMLVLIGLGIREFSMPAPFIPRTKMFLKDLDSRQALETAKAVLQMSETGAIRSYLIEQLKIIELR
jgi:phosphotransferase system, enzyme I, PtsP